GRVLAHGELAAVEGAGRGEPPPEDAEVASVLLVALPDDDEAPGGVDRDGGPLLVAGGELVQLQLVAGGGAGRGVAPDEDAVLVAGPVLALPPPHEAAIRQAGHLRDVLGVGRVLVHLELVSRGCRLRGARERTGEERQQSYGGWE